MYNVRAYCNICYVHLFINNRKRKVNYRVHSAHLLGILLPFTCTWEVKTSYRTLLFIPCNYCKGTAKLTYSYQHSVVYPVVTNSKADINTGLTAKLQL